MTCQLFTPSVFLRTWFAPLAIYPQEPPAATAHFAPSLEARLLFLRGSSRGALRSLSTLFVILHLPIVPTLIIFLFVYPYTRLKGGRRELGRERKPFVVCIVASQTEKGKRGGKYTKCRQKNKTWIRYITVTGTCLSLHPDWYSGLLR